MAAAALISIMVHGSAGAASATPPGGAAQTGTVQVTSVVAEARSAFDDALLDYRSTRFRQVKLVQTNDGFQAFCGEMNTTNRMGGFTGWTPFMLPLGDSPSAKLMDRPTIQGQPTKLDAFLTAYGPAESGKRDSSGRIISSHCGEMAKPVDVTDYSDALTFR
jgi:hypothetical protein